MNDFMWLTSHFDGGTKERTCYLLSTYEQLSLSQRLFNLTMRNRPLLSTLPPAGLGQIFVRSCHWRTPAVSASQLLPGAQKRIPMAPKTTSTGAPKESSTSALSRQC